MWFWDNQTSMCKRCPHPAYNSKRMRTLNGRAKPIKLYLNDPKLGEKFSDMTPKCISN